MDQSRGEAVLSSGEQYLAEPPTEADLRPVGPARHGRAVGDRSGNGRAPDSGNAALAEAVAAVAAGSEGRGARRRGLEA